MGFIRRAASGTAQLVEATAPPSVLLVETAVAGIHAALVLLAIAVGLLTPVALVRRTPKTTRGRPLDA